MRREQRLDPVAIGEREAPPRRLAEARGSLLGAGHKLGAGETPAIERGALGPWRSDFGTEARQPVEHRLGQRAVGGELAAIEA